MAGHSQSSKTSHHNRKDIRGKILAWYDKNHRKLPWRAPPGQKMEPYKVWLSEIMLQQTVVNAVIPYFLKFTQLWPTVNDLSNAKSEEVMKHWAGLGYYARARNLHACAKVIVKDYGGKFPDSRAELKKLPGIGDYTSAAITAIAFNKPAPVMDGNIERVVARLYAVKGQLPKIKSQLKEKVEQLFTEDRPGDLAQALMDLGAGICTPKSPKCMLCPINHKCTAHAKGIQESLPEKARKKAKPQKHGFVYWIEDGKGNVLLHKRPEKGMLGGMMGFPTSEWNEKPDELKEFKNTKSKKEKVLHNFTHFDLTLTVKAGQGSFKGKEYIWHPVNDIEEIGFPTLFKKTLKIARA